MLKRLLLASAMLALISAPAFTQTQSPDGRECLATRDPAACARYLEELARKEDELARKKVELARRGVELAEQGVDLARCNMFRGAQARECFALYDRKWGPPH